MTASPFVADLEQESLGPQSWEQIVIEYSPQVYRLAFRLTGNTHDAQDLTQDVFVRVFRSLHTYREGTFAGWLHRITVNLFLDRVRRAKRIRFDALTEATASVLAAKDRSPHEHYEHTHLDGDIQDALNQLSPEFRAAVVLSDVEGMTYQEVADALGIKMGTVRSRIHRGRAQLRTLLAHRAPTRAPRAGLAPLRASWSPT